MLHNRESGDIIPILFREMHVSLIPGRRILNVFASEDFHIRCPNPHFILWQNRNLIIRCLASFSVPRLNERPFTVQLCSASSFLFLLFFLSLSKRPSIISRQIIFWNSYVINTENRIGNAQCVITGTASQPLRQDRM